jgi:hypothetical protein
VAALANQLARLIRPLHGTSPVDWGSGARRLAPVWLGKGSPPKLSRKNDQRPRRALSACGLMTEERGKVNAALGLMRQSGGSPLVRPPGLEPDRLGTIGHSIEALSRGEARQAEAPGFSGVQCCDMPACFRPVSPLTAERALMRSLPVVGEPDYGMRCRQR